MGDLRHYMNYTIEHGRPLDTENRIKREMDCYNVLDSLEIEYDRIDHEPIFDSEKLKEVRDVLETGANKNLLLTNTQETKFFLLLMPAGKPFRTSEFSKKVNSTRLQFAKEERLLELLNATSGSLNILSLMYDKGKRVQLAIDSDVLKNEYIGLHPMINTASIKIKTKDILNKFLPFIDHDYIEIELNG